ncbi:MAG: hypothetical protein DI536_13885 [Archangium gephyra]|uniref:Uncharacterized protein n=1 Tax=Archangium gephyra TaxID=48 RepID=A0A2W5TB17_9BACT|nr:MAG: hypothetical protein DI536_13885 [Archangium gephyra]
MRPNRLDFSLRAPGSTDSRVIGTLRWPTELSDEAMAFLRDNVFAERLGNARKVAKLLETQVLLPSERPTFLADRPFFPPEAPDALAAQVDLEDLVADFAVVLRELRAAPPDLELVLTFSQEAADTRGTPL